MFLKNKNLRALEKSRGSTHRPSLLMPRACLEHTQGSFEHLTLTMSGLLNKMIIVLQYHQIKIEQLCLWKKWGKQKRWKWWKWHSIWWCWWPWYRRWSSWNFDIETFEFLREFIATKGGISRVSGLAAHDSANLEQRPTEN